MGYATFQSPRKDSGQISIFLLWLLLVSMLMGYAVIAYKSDAELWADCEKVARINNGRLVGVKRGLIGYHCDWR